MNKYHRNQADFRILCTVAVVVVALALSPAASAEDPKPDPAPDKPSGAPLKPEVVLNNGGRIVQSGTKTYFVTDADPTQPDGPATRGALYSVSPEGPIRRIARFGGTQLWALGGALYVSGDNAWTSKTYKINPEDGKESLICDGALVGWGPDNKTAHFEGFVAQKEQPKFPGLYKINIETLKTEGIMEAGDTRELAALGVIDEKLYFCTKTRDGSLTIHSQDMKSGKTTVLTTHKKNDNPDEESGDDNEVTQLSLCGDWLIYTLGSYQGSMGNFYGKTYRIKPDGADRAPMNIKAGDGVSTFDNWIIYREDDPEADDSQYFMVRPDMSEKKKMKISQAQGSLLALPGDGWMYYKKPSGDIHRSRPDGGGDTVIMTVDKLPNKRREKDDSYNYTLDVVGDVIYLKVQVMGFRDTAGWRDAVINDSFNRFKVDGTGFQTLPRF